MSFFPADPARITVLSFDETARRGVRMAIVIKPVVSAAVAGLALATTSAVAADKPGNGPYAVSDWAALGKLPDWSGVWVPDVADQHRKEAADRPPWTPKVAAEVAKLEADSRAGRPFLVLHDCLPYGMPALMLIPHNSMEVLFTPGRVTMLGESDGNRLRRIYTDGRKHPDDPDLTAHGHSIGHWEGDTLVVDTTAIKPQAYLAISEDVGVPNDGEAHVVERIHLKSPDVLADDLTVDAPKILTKSWRTTRYWTRLHGEKNDIVEGACVEGMVRPAKDANGHDVYQTAPVSKDGATVPYAR
jgi:hypothetical protein